MAQEGFQDNARIYKHQSKEEQFVSPKEVFQSLMQSEQSTPLQNKLDAIHLKSSEANFSHSKEEESQKPTKKSERQKTQLWTLEQLKLYRKCFEHYQVEVGQIRRISSKTLRSIAKLFNSQTVNRRSEKELMMLHQMAKQKEKTLKDYQIVNLLNLQLSSDQFSKKKSFVETSEKADSEFLTNRVPLLENLPIKQNGEEKQKVMNPKEVFLPLMQSEQSTPLQNKLDAIHLKSSEANFSHSKEEESYKEQLPMELHQMQKQKQKTLNDDQILKLPNLQLSSKKKSKRNLVFETNSADDSLFLKRSIYLWQQQIKNFPDDKDKEIQLDLVCNFEAKNMQFCMYIKKPSQQQNKNCGIGDNSEN